MLTATCFFFSFFCDKDGNLSSVHFPLSTHCTAVYASACQLHVDILRCTMTTMISVYSPNTDKSEKVFILSYVCLCVCVCVCVCFGSSFENISSSFTVLIHQFLSMSVSPWVILPRIPSFVKVMSLLFLCLCLFLSVCYVYSLCVFEIQFISSIFHYYCTIIASLFSCGFRDVFPTGLALQQITIIISNCRKIWLLLCTALPLC